MCAESHSRKVYTKDRIKAENSADQKTVRLFDGSTNPKIFKFATVVFNTMNSGKNIVSTYSVSTDRIVPMNTKPSPLLGSPNIARKGLEKKKRAVNATQTIKKAHWLLP